MSTENISKIVANAKESTKNLWPDEGRHVWRLIDQIETALEAETPDTEATRLRDGTEALIDEWDEFARGARLNADTANEPLTQALAQQRAKLNTVRIEALRALLDGEAKG